MTKTASIPTFGLYGEQNDFPDVVHCETLFARAPRHDWIIRPHRHERMSQLFLIADGTITMTVDDTKLELSDDCFAFVPQQCVHALAIRPDTNGTVFSFPQSTTQSVGPDAGATHSALSQPGWGQAPARLCQAADLLRTLAAEDSMYRSQILLSLSHAVLGILAEQRDTPEDPPTTASARLRELDTLIARHLADGWSASDYAHALLVSTGHLTRLCRASVGVGAAAYIERARMGEACRLLAFTQLSVSEVGYRVGIGDPSYFSKRFRRAQGQSPLSYRKRFTDNRR